MNKNKKKCDPEEFMPYSSKELSKELIEYARIYLNETEETKKKAIEDVKKFIKNELNVHMEVADVFCLLFLRSRKFNVKNTCAALKKTADAIDSHRHILDQANSDAIRRLIQSKTLSILPKRDANGRAIIYVRSECWNPDELPMEDVIFSTVVALHDGAANPVNQVAGIVVMFNIKNSTFKQLVEVMKWMIFLIQFLQGCCPVLVKEIHFLHVSPSVKNAWTIVKKFLSEKIRKRVFLYKPSRCNDLHRRINPLLLPEELGGQLGPYSYDHWAGDIKTIEEKYYNRFKQFFDREKK